MYAIIQIYQSHNQSVYLNGNISADLAYSESLSPVGGGKKSCQLQVYQAMSQEVIKYPETNRPEAQQIKKHPDEYISPVPSSRTVLIHFLCGGDSEQNSFLSPLPNSHNIRPAIQ